MLSIKKLLLLLLLSSTLFASMVEVPTFVKSQVLIVEKMNDDNITKEIIQDLLEKQYILYENAVNEILINKKQYISDVKTFSKEIYSLEKIIAINTRAGNSYAVLRDEVVMKTYKVLSLQNSMIKSILLSLNKATLVEFEDAVNAIIIDFQHQISDVYETDYKYILAMPASGKVLKITKDNVKMFYDIQAIHNDMVAYIYKFESKMYRLNKYSKYHLISLVIYVNSIDFVHLVNPVLEEYGLNIIKMLFMSLVVLLMYFFRKTVYAAIEKYILSIGVLTDYSSEISEKIRTSIETLVIAININIIIYIYNDFSSVEMISKLFNIFYVVLVTLIIYKVINVVASVRLRKVTDASENFKNDLVNVGIKIVNFIIMVIGLLVALYFAGVNLTAVLSGLGIGGFAVAFAAKDTISNFFGTLSILFSDVFSQGDWIEIGGHQGVVVEIGLRVTTIRTFDNALIAIPNGTFASKDVKNWDKRILGRRIKMHIGVKYDSKSEDIKNAVEQIHYMLDKHPGIATKATKYEHHKHKYHVAKLVSKDDLEGVKNNLLVYLDSFGDSSINILIYCFTKSVQWSEWLDTKQDVMHQIMEILEKNNLEFAFPSLSVYNENSTKEIEKL